MGISESTMKTAKTTVWNRRCPRLSVARRNGRWLPIKLSLDDWCDAPDTTESVRLDALCCVCARRGFGKQENEREREREREKDEQEEKQRPRNTSWKKPLRGRVSSSLVTAQYIHRTEPPSSFTLHGQRFSLFFFFILFSYAYLRIFFCSFACFDCFAPQKYQRRRARTPIGGSTWLVVGQLSEKCVVYFSSESLEKAEGMSVRTCVLLMGFLVFAPSRFFEKKRDGAQQKWWGKQIREERARQQWMYSST